MGNLIDNIKRIWNNLANASKIRDSYNKSHTVQKRLKRVNFEILDCLLAIVGDSLAILIWPDAYNGIEIFGLFIMVISLIWMLGYRNAIAFGKDDREEYIANTLKILKATFKILCKVIIAIFIIVIVLIALLVLILNSGILTEMFPNLKELVEAIYTNLDSILGLVLT